MLERIGKRPDYDPRTILTYVAAKTERIALGTSVLVLPYHQPMRLAKTAATLDVMSGGRLLLGVGVGVIEQELNAMGSPYKERGAITDETIDILKRLWTEDEPRHHGKRYQFSGMKFSPKPVQKPHIPLLIGGVSRAAIRRAARVGNGWHPTAMPPEELSAAMDYLAAQAQESSRPPRVEGDRQPISRCRSAFPCKAVAPGAMRSVPNRPRWWRNSAPLSRSGWTPWWCPPTRARRRR